MAAEIQKFLPLLHGDGDAGGTKISCELLPPEDTMASGPSACGPSPTCSMESTSKITKPGSQAPQERKGTESSEPIEQLWSVWHEVPMKKVPRVDETQSYPLVMTFCDIENGHV